MKKTFYRTDGNGANVKCSTYFNPDDEERKRRSTGGLDLMPDMDTEIEKCEIAAEEAEDMGGQCVDCCDKVTKIRKFSQDFSQIFSQHFCLFLLMLAVNKTSHTIKWAFWRYFWSR